MKRRRSQQPKPEITIVENASLAAAMLETAAMRGKRIEEKPNGGSLRQKAIKPSSKRSA